MKKSTCACCSPKASADLEEKKLDQQKDNDVIKLKCH